MDKNFVENFKSEELEERLEFGKWTPTSEETMIPDEDGWYQTAYGVTYTIPF